MKLERVQYGDLVEGDEFVDAAAWEEHYTVCRSMFRIRTGYGTMHAPRDWVYRIVDAPIVVTLASPSVVASEDLAEKIRAANEGSSGD